MPTRRLNRQPNGSQIKDYLNVELAAVGVTPETLQLDHVLEGPFLFIGNHPDNVTTAVDLTLGAAMVSPALQRITGGGDNPEVIMQVEGVEFLFDGGTETAAIRRTIMQYARLVYEGDKRTEEIDLFDVAGEIFPYSVETGTMRRTGKLKEINPFFIDFKTDVFTFEPTVASNTVATVPFWVIVHGAAWKSTHGRPDVLVCKDIEDVANFRADRRAQRQLPGGPFSRRRAA